MTPKNLWPITTWCVGTARCVSSSFPYSSSYQRPAMDTACSIGVRPPLSCGHNNLWKSQARKHGRTDFPGTPPISIWGPNPEVVSVSADVDASFMLE